MKVMISIKNLNAYVYMYGVLKKRLQGGNIFVISELHRVIREYTKYPKGTQKKIVEDMMEIGLIKRIDRDHFEIISKVDVKPPFDGDGEPLW